MDAPRFDRLTRSLTNTPSRRRLLGGLVATLGLAAVGFPRAAEGKKKRKNKNKRKKTCKDNTTKCGKKACCRADQICVGGQCVDDVPEPECLSDDDCADNEVFQDGQCVTALGTCPAGADRCGGILDIPCNDNDLCTCFRSTKGDTRCGFAPDDTTCGDCTADTDCGAFGPGAFCTGIFGDNCCSGNLKGFCVLRCPS
jgi:hypothetical protein